MQFHHPGHRLLRGIYRENIQRYTWISIKLVMKSQNALHVVPICVEQAPIDGNTSAELFFKIVNPPSNNITKADLVITTVLIESCYRAPRL